MLNETACRVVSMIMMILLGVLTLFSVISTTYVDSFDRVYYVGDIAVLHALFILSVTVICCMLKKKTGFKLNDRMLLAVLLFFTVATFVFIIWADLPPRFDQRAVRSVAADLLYEIQDDFLPGGYGEIYPHNAGIILFDELIIKIAGYDNYLVIQFINLICMVLSFAALYCIMKRLGADHRGIMLGCLLFLPYWGYATFMYGTIPGYCAGLWGVFFCLRFLDEGRPLDAVLSGLLLALAFRFKENFIILIIAVIILVVLRSLREKKYSGMLFIIPLALFYLLSGVLVTAGITAQTGHGMGEGIPGISYMAMGLHEHEERGAGWHDNYPEDTYEATGYDAGETARLSREDITASLDNFVRHPVYAVGFFVRKTASLWNDPTYYSWTLQQGRNDKADGILLLPGTVWIYGIMNFMQTFIYFFAMVWFLLHRKDNNFSKLLFAVFFIGGFLCHTIWEAHCQYTLLYAMGLCIYAGEGFIGLCRKLQDRSRDKNIKAAAALIGIGLVLSLPQIASFLTLSRDNVRFAEYLGL